MLSLPSKEQAEFSTDVMFLSLGRSKFIKIHSGFSVCACVRACTSTGRPINQLKPSRTEAAVGTDAVSALASTTHAAVFALVHVCVQARARAQAQTMSRSKQL